MATRDEFKAANKRGNRVLAKGPVAQAATYDTRLRKVIVTLRSGLEFLLDPQQIEGLGGAREADLKMVEITGSGLGLYFPRLDVDLYVPALLEGHFGSKQWAASRLGRVGGRSKSKVKAMAARANGSLGGRPRKLRKPVRA